MDLTSKKVHETARELSSILESAAVGPYRVMRQGDSPNVSPYGSHGFTKETAEKIIELINESPKQHHQTYWIEGPKQI